MGKVLLAFVLVVGLSLTAGAANIHFSLPGSAAPHPLTNLDVDTATGAVILLEVHLDGQGQPVWGANVDMRNPPSPTSPQLLPLAHVAFLGLWGINSGFLAPGFYTFSDALFAGPVGDTAVAQFNLTVPAGLPVSTILTLSALPIAPPNGSHIFGPAGALPTTATDLVIHITPEPATLGLLVLGGLAVLRRRFA